MTGKKSGAATAARAQKTEERTFPANLHPQSVRSNLRAALLEIVFDKELNADDRLQAAGLLMNMVTKRKAITW